MVITEQVMDKIVQEGADDKDEEVAKDVTEVEDEGTELVGVMMCYKWDGRGDGGGGGHGDGDGWES